VVYKDSCLGHCIRSCVDYALYCVHYPYSVARLLNDGLTAYNSRPQGVVIHSLRTPTRSKAQHTGKHDWGTPNFFRTLPHHFPLTQIPQQVWWAATTKPNKANLPVPTTNRTGLSPAVRLSTVMRRSSNAPSFRRTPAESWKFCHGRKRWGESETSAGLATSGIVTGRRRGKVMGGRRGSLRRCDESEQSRTREWLSEGFLTARSRVRGWTSVDRGCNSANSTPQIHRSPDRFTANM